MRRFMPTQCSVKPLCGLRSISYSSETQRLISTIMHAVCFQYLMTGRCIKRSKCEYLHPFPASTNSSPAKGRSTVIRNLSLSPTSSSPEPSTTSTAVTNCPTPTSDKERRDLKKVGNGLRLPPGKQQVELSGGSYLQLELEVALLELEIERSRNAQMRTKLEKERLSQTKAEEKAKDGEPDKEDAIRAHEDVEESLDHVIVALKEMENRIEETLRKELEAERKEIARENMEAGPKEERALQGTEKAKRSEVEVDQHLGVARRATQEAELSIKSTSGTLVAPDPQEPLFRKANRSFHIWRSVDPGESKPTGGASLAELRATAAMRDYNTTVQRLLWGSTLVTYGAGLKVSSVIYGFDNGFIAIHGLPLDVKEGDIEYLLRDLGTRFCVVDTRQYGDGTISATAIVEGNQKHSVAGRLTGKTVRGRTINANAIEHTRDPAPPYALNIAWEFPTRRSTRSTVSEFYLQEFYVCLRRELESSSGLSSYEFISPTLKGPRNMATVRFRTWSAAKKVHDQLAGKRLRPHFPVIQCSLRPHEPKTKYALRIPLQLRNIHGSKLHRRNIVATGILEANDQTTTVECLSPGWFDGWHWSSDSRTLEFFEYDIVRKDSGISMIKRDWLTKTLTFYATTQAAIDSVLGQIQRFACLSDLIEYSTQLERRFTLSLHENSKFAALKQELGEDKVWLDVHSSNCMLKYRGGCRSLSSIQRFVDDIKKSTLHGDEPQKTCPACRREANQYIGLTCGREYCVSCMKLYLFSAPAQSRFPLTCPGDDQCQKPISIPIIQSLLSPVEFEQLLEKAALSYFSRHRHQHRYCVTATCMQMYRVNNGSPEALTCPSCLTSFCSVCRARAHGSTRCESISIPTGKT